MYKWSKIIYYKTNCKNIILSLLKVLGQNFLVDDSVLNDIVNGAEVR